MIAMLMMLRALAAAREICDDGTDADDHESDNGCDKREAPQRVGRDIILVVIVGSCWICGRLNRIGIARISISIVRFRRHGNVGLDIIRWVERLLDVNTGRKIVLAIRQHLRVEVESKLDDARVQRETEYAIEACVTRPEDSPVVDRQPSISGGELKLLLRVHEEALDDE